MDIKEILQSQKDFFRSGATLPVSFRLDALRRLRALIVSREDEICRALASDLGKSDYESYMCEVGLALSEISYMIRHLRKVFPGKDRPDPSFTIRFKKFS